MSYIAILSVWNLEKRFTGWCDVPLTAVGEADGKDAGNLLRDRGLKFDVAFTSNLERAWRTCAIILSASGQSNVEVVRSWKLNERHYGILQGHRKNSKRLFDAFGEETVMEWRKSYHMAPPAVDDMEMLERLGGVDSFNLATSLMDPRYVEIAPYSEQRSDTISSDFTDVKGTQSKHDFLDIPLPEEFPKTESLKQCEIRAYGYWNEVIAPRVKKGERVLIVAHANTIRSMVKAIDDVDDEQIKYLKIPNGIPFVYALDENLKPIENAEGAGDLGFEGKYLVSGRNHPKLMDYERCVRKKMTALFEYLDENGDGKITTDCLHNGLVRLNSRAHEDITCEFELEEILRCIPAADESGGVNLKAFLDAEENLLPKLTQLKLLK